MIVFLIIFLCVSAIIIYASQQKNLPKSKFPPINIDWRNGENRMKELLPSKTGDKYAIIGCGFLGQWLLKFLADRGERNIICADIVEPDLEGIRLEYGNDVVTFIRCDITKKVDIYEVLESVDAVFLTSALIMYHQRQPFQLKTSYDVNVLGTNNVVNVCREMGVKRLIQTSTSHVCVGADTDQTHFLDESSPYTAEPLDHYTKTKILAEKIILESPSDLLTTVVRPCSGIFGYKDRLVTENHLKRGTCQMLVVNEMIDFVYVENICLGHLLADAKLRENSALSKEIFCISNEQPMKGIEFYSCLRSYYPALQLITPSRSIMNIVAAIIEWLQWFRYKTGGKWSLGEMELLTPATMHLTTLSYKFSSEKARRILGYEPAYTVDEGLKKTVDLFLSAKHTDSLMNGEAF